MVSLVKVPQVPSDNVPDGLMHVDYVKTCKGCGTVFTSGTGSDYCSYVCFSEHVCGSSAEPTHPLAGVRLPRLTGGGRMVNGSVGVG